MSKKNSIAAATNADPNRNAAESDIIPALNPAISLMYAMSFGAIDPITNANERYNPEAVAR